jgi:hypothetical protein
MDGLSIKVDPVRNEVQMPMAGVPMFDDQPLGVQHSHAIQVFARYFDFLRLAQLFIPMKGQYRMKDRLADRIV